jgi:hypothetical protein
MWQNMRFDSRACFHNFNHKNSFKLALRIFGTVVLCSAVSVGCSNVFSSFANTTRDEALYQQVKIDLNDENYEDAVANCVAMSVPFSLETNSLYLCATAYAGRCGLRATDTLNTIAQATTVPPGLLEVLGTNITSSTVTGVADCNTAIEKIRTIGAAADRTTDQNVFMLLLGLHTMGAVVNQYADKYSSDADDGTIPGAFDACDTTHLTAPIMDIFGLAYWEMYQSSAELTTPGTFYEDLNLALTAVCTAVGVVPGATYNFCNSVTPTAFTADERNGLRSIIREGAAFGLDVCGGNANIGDCHCL